MTTRWDLVPTAIAYTGPDGLTRRLDGSEEDPMGFRCPEGAHATTRADGSKCCDDGFTQVCLSQRRVTPRADADPGGWVRRTGGGGPITVIRDDARSDVATPPAAHPRGQTATSLLAFGPREARTDTAETACTCRTAPPGKVYVRSEHCRCGQEAARGDSAPRRRSQTEVSLGAFGPRR